jgi:hypothetical protein
MRDFIQDIANGRTESAEPSPPPEQSGSAAQIQQMLAESEALLNNVRKLLAA